MPLQLGIDYIKHMIYNIRGADVAREMQVYFERRTSGIPEYDLPIPLT